MSGIVGYIRDAKPNLARFIVRRTPEIDALLVEAGYDPSEINCAYTPLVGASDHARIKVLVYSTGADDPGVVPAFKFPAFDTNSNLWEMWLLEPQGGETPVYYNPIQPNTLPLPSIIPSSRFDVDFENVNPGGGEGQGVTADAKQTVSDTAVGGAVNYGTGARQDEVTASGLTAIAESVGGKGARTFALAGGSGGGPQVGGGGNGGGPNTGTGSGGGATGSNSAASSINPLNSTTPRWMHWNHLIPTSICELRRSASAKPEVKEDGRPRLGDHALFVIEFVDYRYALQSLFGAYSMSQIVGRGTVDGFFKDAAGNRVVGGPVASGCFNMLAETPIAFEAQTVKLTYLYPPAVSRVGFGTFNNDPDNSGTINSSAIPIANLAAAPTHVQVPYGLDEILEQFASTVERMSQGWLKLSRINWDASVAASPVPLVDDGDLVNLDFRGMSVGQALDALAQRIGAVWVWDRSASTLMLQLAALESEKYDTPSLKEWLEQMEVHRVAGYINSLTLDVPRTVIVSHESVYCSTIGPYEYGNDGDAKTLDDLETYAHFVDCRSATTEGGFISTKFVTGLNTRSPMIWHTSDQTPAHLSVEIKDHIPAFIGSYYPPGTPIVSLPGERQDVYGRQFTTFGLGTAPGNMGGQQSTAAQFYEYAPWNYSAGSLAMAFKANPVSTSSGSITRPPSDPTATSVDRLAVTLFKRRAIYEQRMARLRAIVDGDLVCNRMPPTYWSGNKRSHTPSVGLQHETVEFGFDSTMTVRYRLSGKNTHPLLYPHGATVKRVSGGPNVTAFTMTGTQNITVRRRESNNIKRAFLCRFEPATQISTSLQSSSNPGDLPFIYLYKFVEVVPDINAATMYFAQQDALGWGRAEGYALNICEMNYRSDNGQPMAPSVAWDGTELQFKATASDGVTPLDQVYPTAPAGYGICYEVFNRAGFTSYYLFAPPGVDVACARSTFTLAPSPWPYMGVSGTAKPTDSQIVDDIMGA